MALPFSSIVSPDKLRNIRFRNRKAKLNPAVDAQNQAFANYSSTASGGASEAPGNLNFGPGFAAALLAKKRYDMLKAQAEAQNQASLGAINRNYFQAGQNLEAGLEGRGIMKSGEAMRTRIALGAEEKAARAAAEQEFLNTLNALGMDYATALANAQAAAGGTQPGTVPLPGPIPGPTPMPGPGGTPVPRPVPTPGTIPTPGTVPTPGTGGGRPPMPTPGPGMVNCGPNATWNGTRCVPNTPTRPSYVPPNASADTAETIIENRPKPVGGGQGSGAPISVNCGPNATWNGTRCVPNTPTRPSVVPATASADTAETIIAAQPTPVQGGRGTTPASVNCGPGKKWNGTRCVPKAGGATSPKPKPKPSTAVGASPKPVVAAAPKPVGLTTPAPAPKPAGGGQGGSSPVSVNCGPGKKWNGTQCVPNTATTSSSTTKPVSTVLKPTGKPRPLPKPPKQAAPIGKL